MTQQRTSGIPKLESKTEPEKTYGDWAGKLGTGEVQKGDDDLFHAICIIDNASITPNPFRTFKAAESWVKEQIEAD